VRLAIRRENTEKFTHRVVNFGRKSYIRRLKRILGREI
jgi:hypothetical protein